MKMRLNSWYKANKALICLFIYLEACHFTSGSSISDGDTESGVHVRIRRQGDGSCGVHNLQCAQAPTSRSVCGNPEEKCVGVRAVVQTFPPSLSCVYVCQPISPRVTDPQNNTDSFFNQTTNGPQNVSTEADTSTTDWTNDPTFCSASFQCQNGGKCSARSENAPSCDCPPEWHGPKCEDTCSMICLNNGTCRYMDSKQSCVCALGYSGTYCGTSTVIRHVVREEHYGYWYIYVIVLFVVLMGVLVGYMMLKRMRGRSLLVTRMFHFFQPYEDDDEKLFDAFISFKSSNKDYSQSEDEKFVLRTLQPKLEKELQFKLCVHYRDFMPGETIANNIMWAVENSRRTILILSPLYIESEWARLEYQKAQQEMLQLRHKIIPIVLEDISHITIEDPNLKHILSSVTYIEYPRDTDERQQRKFWEMFQLALPKKRSRDGHLNRLSQTSSLIPSSEIIMSKGLQQCAITDNVNSPGPQNLDDLNINDGVNPKNGLSSSTSVEIISENNERDINPSKNADKFIHILEHE